ncbi:MAG: CcoQ/FixQ family Cbb3-type cytochrome c oxidase assembly chaperone [Arcobacteraceae bacterium]
MEYETLLTVQAYAKFALLAVVCIVFYTYAFSIYRRDKKGETNYESYSNLVLDDSIEAQPLEKRKSNNKS